MQESASSGSGHPTEQHEKLADDNDARGGWPAIGQLIYREVLYAGLACVSVGLLLFELTHETSGSARRVFGYIDICIASAFLADFAIGFSRSSSKTQFFCQRWYELLASIPISGSVLQALRPLRVVRVLRLIRLAARLRRVADFTLEGPAWELFNLGSVVSTIVFCWCSGFLRS